MFDCKNLSQHVQFFLPVTAPGSGARPQCTGVMCRPLILAGGRKEREKGGEVAPYRAQSAVCVRAGRTRQLEVRPARILR